MAIIKDRVDQWGRARVTELLTFDERECDVICQHQNVST